MENKTIKTIITNNTNNEIEIDFVTKIHSYNKILESIHSEFGSTDIFKAIENPNNIYNFEPDMIFCWDENLGSDMLSQRDVFKLYSNNIDSIVVGDNNIYIHDDELVYKIDPVVLDTFYDYFAQDKILFIINNNNKNLNPYLISATTAVLDDITWLQHRIPYLDEIDEQLQKRAMLQFKEYKLLLREFVTYYARLGYVGGLLVYNF